MFRIASRIRQHLTAPQSRHRQIVLGIVWVGLFLMIGKLAGAAKEMALAWRFGVGPTVDAYVFVFSLVSWPVSIWASVLVVVLVPLATRLNHEAQGALTIFRAELLGFTLVSGVAIGLLMWWLIPMFLLQGWLGLSSTALTHALDMIGPLAIVVPLGMVISLLSAWMVASGNHQNTLFEAIPAFILLLALLAPATWISEPLLLGTVAGFVLHVFVLLIRLHQDNGYELPSFTRRSPVWKFFWNGMGIVAIGQMLMGFTNLIDQFFAANLATGALSTLSYVNRILALILGLGATAISRAMMPVFAATEAECRQNATSLALRWTLWMFALGIIVMLISWIMAPKLVELLFQRGAFNELDSVRVSDLLRNALYQVPFYFSSVCLVIYVGTLRRYEVLMYLGGLGLIIKLCSIWLLIQSLDLVGIVLSQGLIYLINTIALYLYIRHVEKHHVET